MSTTAPSRPAIRVVIVHHGPSEATRECVAAVLADPSTVARRVVVVDNSGNLEDRDLPPGVALLRCPENPGFGAGVHRGLAHLESLEAPSATSLSRGPILALNHDVILAAGFLDAAVAVLAEKRVGAAAGPLYLDRLGGRLWYAGGHVRRLTGTLFQSREAADARRSRDVGFLPGAALAIDADAWLETGGFDPSIFLYHEDVDLCLRLARAGWRLRFAPDLAAVHRLGSATGSADASPFYLEELTATRLRPFHGRLYRLYLALVHSLWVGWRTARYALRRGPGDIERARALLRGHRRALGTTFGTTTDPAGIQSRRHG